MLADHETYGDTLKSLYTRYGVHFIDRQRPMKTIKFGELLTALWYRTS